MTEPTPEDLEPTLEQPDPEEYEPGERTRAVSDATGTVYDPLGEPDSTPHDDVPEEGTL